MTAPVRNALFWTPRILCILFAAFVSLFALDMLSTSEPWRRQIVGFLVHLQLPGSRRFHPSIDPRRVLARLRLRRSEGLDRE